MTLIERFKSKFVDWEISFGRSFVIYAMITGLTQWDRILGSQSPVRTHDWFDSTAYFWSSCFGLSKVFDFHAFNPNWVGGFECSSSGIVPFGPLSLIFAAAPIWFSYGLIVAILFFGSFWGWSALNRALSFRLPEPLIWALSLLYANFFLGNYVQMFSYAPALLAVAWTLGGISAFHSRTERFLGLLFTIVTTLSVSPAFYVPFLPITHFALLIIFKSHSKDGIKGSIRRYVIFWAVLAALVFYPMLLQFSEVPSLMRVEMFPFWGPFHFKEIISELWVGETKAYLKPLLFAAAFSAPVLSVAISKKNDRVWSKLLLLLFILFVFSYVGMPYVNLWRNQHPDAQSFFFANNWTRFYLTIPLVMGLISLYARKRMAELVFVRRFILCAIFIAAAFALAIIDKWTLFSLLILFTAAELTNRRASRGLIWTLSIVGVFGLAWAERFRFSQTLETETLVSISLPDARRLKESLEPSDQKRYRTIAVGVHPGFVVREGFMAADGYWTAYPLSYKRVWEKAMWPSYTRKYGEVIPYFKFWGGRAYAFLPGAEEGNSVETCPDRPLILDELLDRKRTSELAVKWIVSRCLFEEKGLKKIMDPAPVRPVYFWKSLRKLLSPGAFKDPVPTYIYELESPHAIAERIGSTLRVRVNLCRRLKKHGVKEIPGEFGFELPLDSSTEVWDDFDRCYPFATSARTL